MRVIATNVRSVTTDYWLESVLFEFMGIKHSRLESTENVAWRVTLIAGCLSLLGYFYLAFSSRHYADTTLAELLGTSFICAVLCFATWFTHHRLRCDVSVSLLLVFAVLFRLIGISAFPILEDDVYRYLWDGYLTVTADGPYQRAPAYFFGQEGLSPRFEEILSLINYPDISTVYGPVCQWVFAVAYLISPGESWPLQLIFSVADIGVILLLLRFARSNAVLLYAWCPLIVKEFAFTAHPDVLGVFCLMLAFWCLRQKQFVRVGALVGLAAGVKVFALLLVPFLLGFNWRAWGAFAITLVLVALPFGLVDAWLPQGLKSMGNDWLFNAPLYVLLGNWFSVSSIKIGLLLVLLICVGGYALKELKNRSTAVPRGDYLYAALLLCVPVFNPWYLVWLLPFGVIRPSLWAWCASVSVLLAYASGINLRSQTLQAYEIPNWIVLLEFGVIVVAAIVQWCLNSRTPKQASSLE